MKVPIIDVAVERELLDLARAIRPYLKRGELFAAGDETGEAVEDDLDDDDDEDDDEEDDGEDDEGEASD